MKHLKRILVIILIIFIVFLLYDIYLKLKEDNINIDFSMFLGTYNSIINVSMPDDENINTSIINSNNASTNLQNIPSNHFYYNQLDNNGKIIYNALEENIPNLKLRKFTKQELIDSEDFTYIMLMDSYYNNEGKLTNMW